MGDNNSEAANQSQVGGVRVLNPVATLKGNMAFLNNGSKVQKRDVLSFYWHAV
jgi:hypothetical protein